MTSSMETAEALTEAKDHAVRAWYLFTRERNLKTTVRGWEATAALDGSPYLRVQVVGPRAAYALRLFTSEYPLVLRPDDQRPAYDYSIPGQVACVWRRGGVWVELWHPDKPTPKTVPVAARPPLTAASPTSAARPSLISRASARLPYTRRKKENTSR